MARTAAGTPLLERQALSLASQGCSVEVIARTLGVSRYRVEQTVGSSPAGRSDSPYRYRRLFAEVNIPGRYRAGESAEHIAHALGISVTTVFDLLSREGVTLRGKTSSHVRSYRDVLTPSFLREQYVEARRGTWDIAIEVGCSEATIRNWLRRHGLPTRPMEDRRRAYTFADELLDAVSGGSLAPETAAAQVGCSRTELCRALARTGRSLPHRRRPELTRELLKRMYEDQQMTCPAIAAATGWATGTIRARLRQYEIPRRLGPPKRLSSSDQQL